MLATSSICPTSPDEVWSFLRCAQHLSKIPLLNVNHYHKSSEKLLLSLSFKDIFNSTLTNLKTSKIIATFFQKGKIIDKQINFTETNEVYFLESDAEFEYGEVKIRIILNTAGHLYEVSFALIKLFITFSTENIFCFQNQFL